MALREIVSSKGGGAGPFGNHNTDTLSSFAWGLPFFPWCVGLSFQQGSCGFWCSWQPPPPLWFLGRWFIPSLASAVGSPGGWGGGEEV